MSPNAIARENFGVRTPEDLTATSALLKRFLDDVPLE
jgi:hypothetical protein